MSWDNAASDIDKQLLNLRQVATRLSGYPLKYAFYGKNVPTYLTNNTKLQNYFVRNAGDNTQYLSTAEEVLPVSVDMTNAARNRRRGARAVL